MVASHSHEAAYDAFMTGYAFAKILKFKEIDEIFARKRAADGKRKGGKKTQEDDLGLGVENLPKPDELKDTPVDFEHKFGASLLNKTMLNQYENGACFHLDPAKSCQAQAASEAKHVSLVWIRFIDSFDISELSASTLAQLFADYGDFQLLKDAP